ncbi:hypothetical protein Tco_0371020 [Tanacetum coccineum]
MKLLLFTLNIPTKSISELSLTLSPNDVSKRHSQGHMLNTKSTLWNFSTQNLLLKNPTGSGSLSLQGVLREKNYEAIPSIEIVREWFPTIGYSRTIEAKGTFKKAFLPPRWRLLMAQIIQCLGGRLVAVLVKFQAPNASAYIKKRVP